MRWNSWTWKFSKNYAVDFDFLYQCRWFKGGLTLYAPLIKFDWFKGDHNPQFTIQLVIFNIMIYNLNIYNVNHVEESDEDDHDGV